jgi:hypothetical protein
MVTSMNLFQNYVKYYDKVNETVYLNIHISSGLT